MVPRAGGCSCPLKNKLITFVIYLHYKLQRQITSRKRIKIKNLKKNVWDFHDSFSFE